MEKKMVIKEEKEYRGMIVELQEDLKHASLAKGRKGLCTADLKEYDKFAVWFDEPVSVSEDGKPLHWVTFDWVVRDKFLIVGNGNDELDKALQPIITRINKGTK
jgi:hypothetical protein